MIAGDLIALVQHVSRERDETLGLVTGCPGPSAFFTCLQCLPPFVRQPLNHMLAARAST